MKYDSVVLSSAFSSVTFPITKVKTTDQFIVKNIDGLDPPDIDVVIGNVTYPGGYYQASRAQNRQIVMTFALNPNWAAGTRVDDLRSQVYAMLPLGWETDAGVTFTIMNGATAVANIKGFVKKVATPPFVKDPIVQVTIDCLSPYFQSLATYDSGNLVLPVSSTNGVGDAPMGYTLTVTMSATKTGLIVNDVDTGAKMQLWYPFLAGDSILFNTVPGSRRIVLSRPAEAARSLVGYLTNDSVWLQLHQGVNRLNIYGTGSGGVSSARFTWQANYWGV